MLPFAICYGIGFLSFLTLIGLMLRSKPSRMGLRIIAVYGITAIWALSAAIAPWWLPGIAQTFDTAHSSAWIIFLASILIGAEKKEGGGNFVFKVVIPVTCFLTVANDLRFLTSATGPASLTATQILLRIALDVCGLLIVENLLRNTVPSRRWHTYPLCIASGTLFAYDLFVFVTATINRGVDPILLSGRGLVLVVIVPALIVTMARNDAWDVDVHVSRRVVLHTATLTAGGIFLLMSAGVAGFIGHVPGDWGAILQLVFLVGSVVTLVTLLSIGSLRSRLSRFLSENFFSARYDYKAEWVRCMATLSGSGDPDPLSIRVVRAIADIVDSPGGALWMSDRNGVYRIVESQNLNLDTHFIERSDGPFIESFKTGKQIQILDSDPNTEVSPAWIKKGHTWIAVPLVRYEQMMGFAVLAYPRAPLSLNQESFDLLLTVASEGASWLCEEQAARALAESQALIEYGRRFSFVAHDVKNVSSQLEIMIANMKTFGDRPEFRADMVRTMEAAIERLHSLLGRLRPGLTASSDTAPDVGAVIRAIANDWRGHTVVVESNIQAAGNCETISDSDLRSVIGHLVANAVEASKSGDRVSISLERDQSQLRIDIKDSGCGMDRPFIQNKLFTPMLSTKKSGHGIGAFQARELILAAGGSLEVDSTVGKGTIFHIALPASDLSFAADTSNSLTAATA